MNKIILVIISAFISVGCSQWQMKRQVELFSKTEICFPTDLKIMRNGLIQDSVLNVLSQQTKLVIYFTTERCSSCEINRMLMYQELFLLKSELFSPVIIMGSNATKHDEIIASLKLQPYPFPIFIDKSDRFKKLNPNLPDDSRFHTFLLDINNRVVLVGNPLAGEPMWNLFKSTLDNLLAHDGVYVVE